MKKLKINVHDWKRLDERRRQDLCRRVEASIPAQVTDTVREVIEAIEREGDAAVIRYSERFDRVQLGGSPLRVSERQLQNAEQMLQEDIKNPKGIG